MTPRFLARKERDVSPRPYARKPRFFRFGIEHLEDRLAPSAGLSPDLIVGRTQSAYSMIDVANNSLSVTYTVYNQRAEDISGILLTTSLQPGVTFTGATQPTDRDGPTLAWGLGTITGFGRASVTVTMTRPAGAAITLDSGARAFGTLDGGAVSADTPAAALTDRALPATFLASTPDANTTDPFVQEQAARLRYDARAIFDYLNEDVGYESYAGSLRGARGTLWAGAGNSLDEASLGVALFRASGIPARYAHGTLTTPVASQLVLSMFPPNFQLVGYIPAGTAVADPANDPRLLAETRDHFWVQFDAGAGFTNADSSGLPGGGIGTAYTVATETFGEVADALRHTVRVSLDAEIYNSASGLFGGLAGDGLSTSTVLDRTFTSVELVGRPLTVGHFVSQSALGSIVFSSRTTNYAPYFAVGDAAEPDGLFDEVRPGTSFQELVTNFPFGSQVLTGLFLRVELSGPGLTTEVHNRTLADRIGYVARQGRATVSVDPSGPPILTGFEAYTLDILPSTLGRGVAERREQALLDIRRQLDALVPSANGVYPVTAETSVLISRRAVATSRAFGGRMLTLADDLTSQFARISRVRSYFDAPRIYISSLVIPPAEGGQPVARVGIDLLNDRIRAVVAPGQVSDAGFGFQVGRGLLHSGAEGEVASAGGSTAVTALAVFEAADQQNVPIVFLADGNDTRLTDLNLSFEATARITAALGAGRTVAVPARPVTLNGTSVVAWFEFHSQTGAAEGILEDGSHGGIAEYVGALTHLAVVYGFLLGVAVFPSIADDPNPRSAKSRTLFAAGGIVTGGSVFSRWLPPNATIIARAFFFSFGVTVAALGYLAGIDPPIPPQLLDLHRPPADEPVTATVPGIASFNPGPVTGSGRAAGTVVRGDLTAEWQSVGRAEFPVRELSAANARLTNAAGTVVGEGTVSLAGLTVASVTGPAGVVVAGRGNLALHGAAGATLGVSGEFETYTATLVGRPAITFTTDGLRLNGQLLPAGTYTLVANEVGTTGSGRIAAPTFAGSALLRIAGGRVFVSDGEGHVTLGGADVNLSDGLSLAGFTGTVTVRADSTATDAVTVLGTSGGAVSIVAPTSVTANQNQPAGFTAVVRAIAADPFDLTVEGPRGWVVAVSPAGVVTVTPAPGTQSGQFGIRLTARSKADPSLVTHIEVPVTVTPTTPGLSFAVTPDPLYTLSHLGAELPTAFRASLRNLGPTADTFSVTVSNLPAGFSLMNGGTRATVPAGESGILGLYLRPIDGTGLPAPGTVLTFDATATSVADPTIVRTQTVTFVMPEVHAVTITATPAAIGTTPGNSFESTLTITAVGNVTETVFLAAADASGLTITGLPASIDAMPGQTVSLSLSLTVAGSTPLNSNLAARITAEFGSPLPPQTPLTQTLLIPVRVAVPGADAIVTAAAAAAALGNADLANRLSDLGTALTSLVQSPTSDVVRSTALSALDAVIGLVGADAYLASLVPSLTNDRSALLSATTAATVQAAVSSLGATLEDVGQTLADAVAHRFTLAFVNNTGVAQPLAPNGFSILLRNTGTQTTTYDLTTHGVPAGVTAAFSQTSVTLAPGQSTFTAGNPNLSVTLTPGASELTPFAFEVRAVARTAPAIAQSISGSLSVRSEVVTVVSVSPTPAFADPGVPVSVAARLLNAVNREQVATVQYTVRNAGGTAVFTSVPVTANMTVLTSLSTVGLGTLNTTGFALGNYTITVTVSDDRGTPVPGATGTGHLLIGSPLTASLTTSPGSLAPGSGTVTATLNVTNTQPQAGPAVTPLGTVAIPGANQVQVLGNRAYVAGTGGIRVVDISNPASPQVLLTFASADIGAGLDVTGMTLDGDRLVVTTGTFAANASAKVLVYSLANPSAPVLLGQSPLTLNGVDFTGTASRAVINHRLYTNTQFFRYFFAGQTVFGQYGQSLVIDVSDPAAPAPVDVIYNRPPEPNFTYPDGLRWPDGSSNIWQAAEVNATTAYIGTTANTRGVVDDAGQILVVDTSNPNDPNVVRTVNVPGMSVVTGIQVVGATAWVIGSTIGWRSGVTPLGLNGKTVIACLNVSDARNPVIEYTKTFEVDSLGLNFLENAGSGLFIGSTLSSSGPNASPNLYVIDTTNPNDVTMTTVGLVAEAKNFTAGNGRVYTGDGTNFTIYQVGVPEPIAVVSQAPVAGAVDAIRNGDFVYVSGTAGISVFNVAGANLSNPQFVRTVGQRPDLLEIRGDLIVAVRGGLNPNSMRLDTYSLADPSNPQLLGTTGEIPYSSAAEMIVTDTHAFVVVVNLFFYVPGNDIFDQQGGLVAINITDPANPFLDGDAVTAAGTPAGRDGVNDGVLFNENGTTNDGISNVAGIDQSGGDRNTWSIVQVSPTIVYVTGSSATGTDTQTGVGLVRVIDISDPRNMRVLRDLPIPGTVQVTGITLAGGTTFVTGSQGGWNDNRPDVSFTGNVVWATLDVSDPANPQLLHTQVGPEASRGITRATAVSLGNGLFAYSNQGAAPTDPGLFVIDTNNPGPFTSFALDIPAEILHMSGGDNLLYTADFGSLFIYRVGLFQATPATARVTVPTDDGVSVVPGSFSLPPTRTIPSAAGTTYEWDLSFAGATTSQTITWQETVTGVQPGRSRTVASNGSVSFVSQGTAGEVDLADQFVTGVQILGLTPTSQTAAPGEAVTFGVILDNPTGASVTYTLGVAGVPGLWIDLASSAIVPANGSVTVPMTLTADAFAALAAYGLTITAKAGSVASSVRGTLTLAGTPVTPDPDSHGVVVSLTPTNATAGPGTTAVYVVRVTNTGSTTETYDVTSSLPAGVAGVFSQSTVTVPPGIGNFREVSLQLTPAAGTTPGERNVSVTATAGGVSDLAEALLTVVNRGVTVSLDRTTLAPGESATATITNTGSVADSFDLSLTGVAGLVSTLGVSRIDLAPGESRTVPVTTNATVDFALAGAMRLTVVSQSLGNAVIRGSASANVMVPQSVGLTAAFRQASRVIAAPGTADFVLDVSNLGTGEDAYEATIVGSTGTVSGVLIGLNSQPAASIPTFRLPGLSLATVTVRANLASAGTGTITVRIRSLSDPTRETVRTATLGTTTVTTRPTPLLVGGATNGTALAYSPAAGQFGPGTALTFFPGFAGDVRTATADVTGDGVDDFIGGSGPGMVAEVAIIDGATNRVIARFSPFESTFRMGVYVAAADLNGDGKADVVVTPDLGGGPVVAAYDGSKLAAGFADGRGFGQPAQIVRYYGIEGDPNFRGGARAAMGDVNGDGTPDLMVSAGFLGGPRIALFNGIDVAAADDTPRHLIPDFYAFETTLRNGAYVALGDITGDGRAELVFGGGSTGGNRVRVFDAATLLAAPHFATLDAAPTSAQLNNFFTGDPSLRGGARVAVKFIDDSGKAALITGSGTDERARVQVYSSALLLASPTPAVPDQVILPFDSVLANGAFVG